MNSYIQKNRHRELLNGSIFFIFYQILNDCQLLNVIIVDSIGGARSAKIATAMRKTVVKDRFEKSVSLHAEPNDRLIRTLAKSTLYSSSNSR